jgi:peptidoglycan/LPS O-acetylase OafA/YrhL
MENQFNSYHSKISQMILISVLCIILFSMNLRILGFDTHKLFIFGYDIFLVSFGFFIEFQIQIKNTKFYKNFFKILNIFFLPLFFLITIICIFLGYLYLTPSDLSELSKIIIANLHFFSNYLFLFENYQILDAKSIFQPLFHFWFISLCTQIILLYLIINFFCKSVYIKNYIYSVILILSLIYFVYSNLKLNNIIFDAKIYFDFFCRLWQFFLGCLLCSILFNNRYELKSIKAIQLISFLILTFFICLTIFFFENNILSSILISLTVLLIFIYKESFFLSFKKNLDSNFFLFLIIFSITLYFTQYPIFTINKILRFTNNILYLKILVIFFIFFISLIISFFFNKILNKKKTDNLRINIYINLFIFFLTIGLSLYIISSRGISDRFYNTKNFTVDTKIYWNQWKKHNSKTASIEFLGKKTKILILGDSQLQDLYNIFYFDNELKNYFEFVYIPKNLTKLDFNDLNQNKNLKDSDFVILGKRWNSNDLNIVKAIATNLNHKNIFIYSNSNILRSFDYYWSPLNLFVKDNKRLPDKKELTHLEEKYFKSINPDSILLSKKIEQISNNLGLNYLNISKFTCNYTNKRCPILDQNNKPLRLDDSHLTLAGSEYFSDKLKSENFFIRLFEKNFTY